MDVSEHGHGLTMLWEPEPIAYGITGLGNKKVQKIKPCPITYSGAPVYVMFVGS